MTKAEDLEMAGEFASSKRGRYIIAKALHYAIGELEKVDGPMKEVSDIDDMKYLRKEIYSFPIEVLDTRVLLGVGELNKAFQQEMKQIQEGTNDLSK